MANIKTVHLTVTEEDYQNGNSISNDAFEVLCGIGCEVKTFRPANCPEGVRYNIDITGNYEHIIEILERHFGNDFGLKIVS